MKQLLTITLVFVSFMGFAQQPQVEVIVSNAQQLAVRKYQIDSNYSHVVIKSAFGEDTILNHQLDSKRIIKIDYVSSLYSSEISFDQKTLDAKRISNLLKNNPALAKMDFLTWNFVQQDGCNSSTECTNFLHGFVVYFTEEPSKISIEKEIEWLEEYSKKVDSILLKRDDLKIRTIEQIDCSNPYLRYSFDTFYKKWKKTRTSKISIDNTVIFEAKLDNKGRVTGLTFSESLGEQERLFRSTFYKSTRWYPAKIGKTDQEALVFGTIDFPVKKRSINILGYDISHDTKIADTVFYQGSFCYCYKFDESFPELLNSIDHSVVSTVIDRNKDNWKKQSIIADVTGSMYPYTGDLLLWLKLAVLKDVEFVTFFNDGDDRTKKPIGNTKGIYSEENISYDAIKKKMYFTMLKGGGGDTPENNFEALLHAKNECPECTDFVMVADNYAYPRDSELLRKFSGNLRIILCGTDFGVNTDYLNLARKYDFSVHTVHKDIYDLVKLHEGESIEIGGSYYKIQDGKFVRYSSI